MPYTEVTVSGYNASPPPDDGTQAANNEITWAGIKTKLTDPLKAALDTTQDNITSAIDAAEARLPTGSVLPYAGASAPSGFLLCDGSAVSRTTFATLFALIGTTYGTGDGSTTFNVPDLKGRVVAGKEASASRLTSAVAGVDGATLGSAGGTQSKTIAQANLPAANLPSSGLSAATTGTVTLTNGTNVLRNKATSSNIAGGGAQVVVNNNTDQNDITASLSASTTISGTVPLGGSGTALAVVQPTIVLNYVIKT